MAIQTVICGDTHGRSLQFIRSSVAITLVIRGDTHSLPGTFGCFWVFWGILGILGYFGVFLGTSSYYRLLCVIKG